ncbi:MAG: hypothetical protein HEQ23_04785 [Tepidisphaera sp.]
MAKPIEANEIGGPSRWPSRIWVAGQEFEVEWFWHEEQVREGFRGWAARTQCKGRELRAGAESWSETLARLAMDVRNTLGVLDDEFRVELPMSLTRLRDL